MLELLSAADPPLLYAVAGVIILAIASLFGLVLFASREETFEDVVEKQRKAQEALLHSLQQGTSAKTGKQNRKWNKLKNKKASKGKGQEEQEIDSGVDDDELSTETVTVSAPPPIIAVEEPAPAPVAAKKKKNKKKKNQQQDVVEKVEEVAKAIVEDVAEPEEIVEEEIVESPTVEVEATPDVPSDDEVEIVVEEEISDEEVEEVAVAVVEDVVAEEEEEEEEVVEVEEPEKVVIPEPEPEPVPAPKVEAVVEKTKSNKKKNKSVANKQKGTVVTNSLEKLSTDLKSCHMNSDEVQQMMDVLLEKQSELEQWQKPNQKSDPIEQLKRRIAEAEMQFAEERQSSQAFAVKNKELKLELQQERNARQSIQNEATNRLNQQAKEAESIRKRLEEKHVSDMHSTQSQISRMQVIIDDGATNHMELQRMKEENAHLKNASMMAQQLAEDKQSLMTELSQLQQTNKALRQEFDNLIIHHQQEMQNIQIAKVDSEGALSQRLQEMNDQLMKVEAHNRNLQLEIAEQQRLSEQARMTEVETFQMAAKPDNQQLEELTKQLAEIQEKLNASEVSSIGYQEKLAAAEQQITECAAEKETEPVNHTEVADLIAQVAEKDEMILQLEQKVSEMENRHSSGQQSPDLVVVTPGDLLDSEPLLTSESFEEVVPDKDYVAEVEEVIVPVMEAAQQSSAPDVVEPEVVVVEISTEESVPEIMEDLTGPLIAEIEQLKGDLTAHEAAVAEKQAEIDALQEKILSIETTTEPAAEPAAVPVDNGAIDELKTKISELEQALAAKDAELAKAGESTETTDDVDGPTKEELAEKLKTVQEELNGRVEATDELKSKNNELREKNWKVIDALAKAEKQVGEVTKSTEIRIIKGLKSILPDFSIPKFEHDYELLFKEFGEKVVETQKTDSADDGLAEVNKCLQDEINELKKTNELMNASQDEILKSQQENGQLKEENAHIKNVLIETESMLCRLQTGVDAEVQKWQKKVTEKDAELEVSKKSNDELKTVLSKHGYEHTDLAVLESALSDGQKQLMAEKEENSRIKTELNETEKNLTDTKTELAQKVQELHEGKTTAGDEVGELSTKLKKTISERDLLIREYKNVKDNSSKMESELKETKETLQTKTHEIEQLKVQISKPTPTTATVENGIPGDAEEVIKKLTAEIEELKEIIEQKEEDSDLVIVDIDPENADNLKKEVEELKTGLQTEKLKVSKLEDIEKSYNQEDETNKLSDVEAQLKLAQQKILELEAANKQKSTPKDGGETRSGTSV